MKRELLEVLAPEGQCGVTNWSIGVFKIDWERSGRAGVKYYGGTLVNGEPPCPCTGFGEWRKSRKAARELAQQDHAEMQAAQRLAQSSGSDGKGEGTVTG